MRPVATLACLLLALVAGCSSGVDTSDAVAAVNSRNIQRLASLYYAYQSEHNWAGPPDEEALKSFIRTVNPDKLKRVGVDPAQIDALFTSDRDEQPFKVRYGVLGSIMGSSEPVIFEATGVGGQREVGFLNMTQREVDDAEYEQLWEGKGASAAPARER